MPTNTSRRGRGQSRKNRVYVFRQWLLQTYGSYLSRLQQEEEHEHRHINAENAAPIPSLPPPLPHEGARPSSGSTRSSSNRRRPLILDVAGGKGDLSWLLNNVDGFESIVVDPLKYQPFQSQSQSQSQLKPSPSRPPPEAKNLTSNQTQQQQQQTIIHTRNARMVNSLQFLCDHPDERTIRAIAGLPSHQPLAEVLPELLTQRAKRLVQSAPSTPSSATTPNVLGHNDDENKTEVASSMRLRPEEFVIPQLLQISLNEDLLHRLRKRLLGSSRNQKDATAVNNCHTNTNKQRTATIDNSKHGNHKHPNNHNDDEDNDEDNDENGGTNDELITTEPATQEALDVFASGRIQLILGFHPDQATEYCLDLAHLLQVPFCIVPCCVFPAEFPQRRRRPQQPEPELDDIMPSSSSDLLPVRTYTEFLDYLRQKHAQLVNDGAPTTNPVDPHCSTTTTTARSTTAHNQELHAAFLDFHFTETAKNIALYTLPPPPSRRLAPSHTTTTGYN